AQLPPHQRQGKFGKKTETVRLLGYASGIKGYKVLSLETGAATVRRDVVFNETDFRRKKATKEDDEVDEESPPTTITTWTPVFDDEEEEQPPAPLQPLQADEDTEEEEPTQEATSPPRSPTQRQQDRILLRINRRNLPQPKSSSSESSSSGEEEPPQEIRRSPRTRKAPVRYGIEEYASLLDEFAFVGAEDDPKTIKEALRRPDAKKWKVAADAEFQALQDNGTWELVPLPVGRTAVGSRWVFRVKRDENGKPLRHKARLVAQGFSQRPGVDYEETFAPVVRFDTIRTLVALAASTGQLLHQVDVETAFLHGRLEEEVYMKQPPGYEDVTRPTDVCRLIKSLYGLKQSPRAWNQVLHEHLLKTGFKRTTSDHCVYIYDTLAGHRLTLAVYVDDILILAPTEDDMQWVKSKLAARFKIKDLGRAHHLLGMKIRRNDQGILMTQSHYVDDLIKKMGFEEAKPIWTPADPNVILELDDGNSSEVDKTDYQALVGSLLYAAVATRPDIAQAVSMVCRFTSSPTAAHLTAAKRILRYLKATKEYGLYYAAGKTTKDK
ncbi:MAG: hypothetical protein GY737_05660, partial [Desulfobacteraceae bacterium]|nr:hypothetical protein [Desulfobacteraceae bacterium]